MTKILVISPSGEVYDHDSVRWYSHLAFATAPDHYHNIGDAFVYDSTLKLLRFSSVFGMNIRDASDVEIDRYNTEFSFAVLRGSNYLHSEMDWENAPAVLSRLKIPVIAFGIGAQAPATGNLKLSVAAQRVMHLIAERSASIGVRGAYTADVLWSLGIRNVRIIGCPTIFRNNNPALRIDLPPLESVRRVGYTLRREVGHDYAEDIERYLSIQRGTVLELAKRFDLQLAAQGEIEEKKVLWGSSEMRETALAQLRAQGWLRGADDPLETIYRNRLFYADSVAEFEAFARSQDLLLGYRLHGNLLGLANGVPAVYFTYDSRTVEFAETLQIPSFNVFGGKTFRLEDYWDQALFEKFNRAYYQRYRDMRLFLDENSVPHKMSDELVATTVASSAAA